jgi:hypothetical protein
MPPEAQTFRAGSADGDDHVVSVNRFGTAPEIIVEDSAQISADGPVCGIQQRGERFDRE